MNAQRAVFAARLFSRTAKRAMLTERIDSEMKDAARAQDKRRLGTIRLLKSQMKYREIETGKALEDADVIATIGSMIKQRRDSIEQYMAGNRPELAQQEREEIVILEAYLPRQFTDEELLALVQEAVTVSGAKGPREMGGVMKALMPKVQGKAEGKRVSDAVKAALSKL
jgi:uncharacterized protein